MASVNRDNVLGSDDLNDTDEFIVEFLSNHEWATPNLLRVKHAEEVKEVSRQWISSRLRRLEEHEHLEKVHSDAAEYRLIDDPRET